MSRNSLSQFAILASIFLTGCGEGFLSASLSSSSSSNEPKGTEALRIPPSDKIDNSCATNPAYDACIFLNDPVLQQSAILGTEPVAGQIDSNLVFGIKLTDLDNSGNLQSKNLKIVDTGFGVLPAGLAVLKTTTDDNPSSVEAAMAYYWANRTIAFLQNRTGLLPINNSQISIVIDDGFPGWVHSKKSIHLTRKPDGMSMAYNASILVHFMGVASLNLASNGVTQKSNITSNHQSCGGSQNGCCSTETGCVKAIASGIGDYFVALMFPDNPAVAAAWANTISGQQKCGLVRNVSVHTALTADDAFGSCNSTSGDGDIHAMGLVYGSIWWEIRKTLESNPERLLAFDKLFMEHLSLVESSDTFVTLLTKIEGLDQSRYGGQFTNLFYSQYRAKGLQ